MPASRLHPLLRLFLCALLVIVVTVVASVVAGGVLLAFASRLGLANLNPTQLTQKITHDYGLILTIFAYPPALFVVWLFRTQIDKRSWSSLGFHRAGSLSNFALGALTGFLTLSVLFALMWLSGAVQFGGLSQDVLTHGWGYSIGALCFYAVAFLLVGFMEETAFRGYALHNANEWLGWRGAVAFQAVIFAVIHLTNVVGNSDPTALKSAIGALPSLALIAVFFAVAYRKTGSLWFPIGFHAAWNFCLGCVFSQPVSAIGTFRLFDMRETGKNFLSGGDFGAEGSFFLIPLVIALIYVLWRAPNHPQATADLDTAEPLYAGAPVAPVLQPQFAYAAASPTPEVYAQVSEEAGEAEEPRENRFRARFGSAEGFDAGMLRELKQMQEARDEAERQKKEAENAARRVEAAHKETLRRAQIAAEAAVPRETESNEVAPVIVEAAPVTPTPVPEQKTEAPAPVTKSVETSQEAPVTTAPPVVEVPPTPVVPVAPTAPKGPSVPVAPPAPITQRPEAVIPATPTTPTEGDTKEASPAPVAPKKARPRW